jgi:hypothetical protein
LSWDVLIPFNRLGAGKLARLTALLERATLSVTVDDAATRCRLTRRTSGRRRTRLRLLAKLEQRSREIGLVVDGKQDASLKAYLASRSRGGVNGG